MSVATGFAAAAVLASCTALAAGAVVVLLRRAQRRHALSLEAERAQSLAILASVDDAMVIARRDGSLEGLRSPSLPEAADVFALIALFDERAARWFRVGWSDLFAGTLPFDAVAQQLPARITDARSPSRTLALTLRLLPAERVLLILRDVTAALEKEMRAADDADAIAVLDLAATEKDLFRQVFTEIDALVVRVREWGATEEVRRRALHTLKGTASVTGLTSLAATCHAAEDACASRGSLTSDDIAHVEEAWSRVRVRVASLVSLDDRVEMTVAEHEALLQAAAIEPRAALVRRIRSLREDERAAQRVERLADHARALAGRTDKEIDVVISADIRVPRDDLAGIWPVLSHAVNNAVDHGVEPPDERRAAGKDTRARLEIAVRDEGSRFVISVIDDGRGIDWAAVADKARAAGLPAATNADLVAALFVDGVSTSTTASTTSGRGVGLSALAAAVKEAGGCISIESSRGIGTRFEIVVPKKDGAGAPGGPYGDVEAA